jgi:hypothetical protein
MTDQDWCARGLKARNHAEPVHNLIRNRFHASRKTGIALAFTRDRGMGRMTARRVATAQREAQVAASQIVAKEVTASESARSEITRSQVTWGELGCPRETGLYRTAGGHKGLPVRVKRIHILVAENDPAALFTVVAVRPPHAPAEFVLGHRVA